MAKQVGLLTNDVLYLEILKTVMYNFLIMKISLLSL